ncbi:DUF1015 domain-containing protein [Rubricoccus marinus]|uniref:DUF1015 domain-containing protein n=1 Tax=Rubricoccus marinus TaxID=716817 RepID=A0A259U0S1_9BACT|nr:DUF1015 family protein [Rubricoccus marinus]OZC03540.1 hypothetical protein BSZ36_11440 [Rubricoccus marinus]
MATVRPFRALRPTPEAAERVASVPYDVISSAEARELAAGNDLSFLHVIRPEIDLPPGTDEHADEVYAAGRAALDRLASSDDFVQEAEPSLYVYRLEMNGRAQVGIMGLVSAQEYDDDVILKHELTRPDKEDDRLRHILTQEAHAEPVMLTYRAHEDIDDAVAQAMEGEPLFDFRAKDYVQHTIWKMKDPGAVVDAFAEVDNLYVADGHHRSAAASRAAKESGAEGAQHFLAVLFPMEDMEILSYNRAIKDLPAGARKFLQQLEARTGELVETPLAEPEEPGVVGVYLGVEFGWLWMTLPETTRDGIADTLDVARLGEHVLEPLLHITDPRTDENIQFIGGIRGTEELERLVDSDECDVAFAMYPTSPEDLLDVSDEGELMPPKSTWFEPKLRSGLLVHRF